MRRRRNTGGLVREREEWKMRCSFHLLVQSSKNWFPKENFKGTNSCELSLKMRTLPVFWWHTQQLCERRQEVGNYTTSEGTTVINMLWQRKVWDFGAACGHILTCAGACPWMCIHDFCVIMLKRCWKRLCHPRWTLRLCELCSVLYCAGYIQKTEGLTHR